MTRLPGETPVLRFHRAVVCFGIKGRQPDHSRLVVVPAGKQKGTASRHIHPVVGLTGAVACSVCRPRGKMDCAFLLYA